MFYFPLSSKLGVDKRKGKRYNPNNLKKGDGSYAQQSCEQQHDDGYDVHVPHVHDDVRAKT